MGKKPGSWSKLNKLTKTVSIRSRKKALTAFLCACIYLLALIPSTYFAVKFLSEILSYEGIETDGKLPDLGSGDYFQVNFSEAPMRDNTILTPVFEKFEIPANPNTGRVTQTRVKSTSLRLEYAYNYIFDSAPEKYISTNFFYKGRYGEANKIEVLDVFLDAGGNTSLSLNNVQNNNLNILNNILHLKIKYKDVVEKSLVMMPTVFAGMEGFLSNFLSFKLDKSRNINPEIPVIWDKQQKLLGGQANGIMLNSNSTDPLILDDMVYDMYTTKFNNFYDSFKGDNSEFLGDYNPYSNFVISSISETDNLMGQPFDSRQYMFDIGSLIDSTKNKINRGLYALGDINEEYVAQLLIFLKNVLVTTKNPNLALPPNIIPPDWQVFYPLLQPKTLDPTVPENFYFMFLPKDETLQNILGNRLVKEITAVLAGDMSFKGIVDSLQDDILEDPTNSKYNWIFTWNIQPFQLYGQIEYFGLNVVKRTIQEPKGINFLNPNLPSTEFITIDQPSLHQVIDVNNTMLLPNNFAITNSLERNRLFANYWSSALYNSARPLNQLNINLNMLPVDETALFDNLLDQFIQNSWQFIVDINQIHGHRFDFFDGMTFGAYTDLFNGPNARYATEIIAIKNTHRESLNLANWLQELITNRDLGVDFTAIDIKIESNDLVAPDALRGMTFRMNIRYAL